MAVAEPLVSEPSRDERPIAYQEGDRFIYRASAIGGCRRALVAARLGFQPEGRSEMIERTAEEGILHEPAVLKRLTDLGFIPQRQQLEVEVPVAGGAIRGHIDCYMQAPSWMVRVENGSIPAGTDVTVEVKTMGESTFSKWCRAQFADKYFERYAVQATIYMHCSKRPLLLAAKNRNTGEVRLWYFDSPPLSIAAILKRVAEIEFTARTGKLPLCDKHDFFCNYKYLCDHGEEEQTLVVKEEAVFNWARKHIEASALEKKYKTLKDQAKDELVKLCQSITGHNTGKLQVGPILVSISWATREYVSIATLKKALGSEADKYIDCTDYTLLRITDRTPKEEQADAQVG